MATAMVASGVTVGAIQVTNKTTGDGIFDERDRDLLEGLAATAAIALRNAQLHAAEKRAGDLAVLLDISREITATLDLDRVLHSVVNLASRALPFDRAAVALYEKGHCDVRAVAGEETVDPKDPKLQDLVARAEWAAGRGEPLYLVERVAPGSDAERMFVTIFGQDLETDAVESGLYLPLKDEEGVLGVLVFESGTVDFATPDPARGGVHPGQPDRGRAPERAALPPGPDGGRIRRPRGEAPGVASDSETPGADLRRHRRAGARGAGAVPLAAAGARRARRSSGPRRTRRCGQWWRALSSGCR